MKPESYKNVPNSILEPWLWNLDLDYCAYESSKAETIHEITNDQISTTNELIVSNCWKMVSEEIWKKMLQDKIDGLRREIDQLEAMKVSFGI